MDLARLAEQWRADKRIRTGFIIAETKTSRARYTLEFKQAAVRRVEGGQSSAEARRKFMTPGVAKSLTRSASPPRRRVVCTWAQGLFAHATAPGTSTVEVAPAKAAGYKHICASESPERVHAARRLAHQACAPEFGACRVTQQFTDNRQPGFSSDPAPSHPLAKHLIHARLPACAGAFEIRHHFGVIAHGDWRLGGPMLRAALALAFLNQGVAHRAIATASDNNSVVARRPFLDSGRAINRQIGFICFEVTDSE